MSARSRYAATQTQTLCVLRRQLHFTSRQVASEDASAVQRHWCFSTVSTLSRASTKWPGARCRVWCLMFGCTFPRTEKLLLCNRFPLFMKTPSHSHMLPGGISLRSERASQFAAKSAKNDTHCSASCHFAIDVHTAWVIDSWLLPSLHSA